MQTIWVLNKLIQDFHWPITQTSFLRSDWTPACPLLPPFSSTDTSPWPLCYVHIPDESGRETQAGVGNANAFLISCFLEFSRVARQSWLMYQEAFEICGAAVQAVSLARLAGGELWDTKLTPWGQVQTQTTTEAGRSLYPILKQVVKKVLLSREDKSLSCGDINLKWSFSNTTLNFPLPHDTASSSLWLKTRLALASLVC